MEQIASAEGAEQELKDRWWFEQSLSTSMGGADVGGAEWKAVPAFCASVAATLPTLIKGSPILSWDDYYYAAAEQLLRAATAGGAPEAELAKLREARDEERLRAAGGDERVAAALQPLPFMLEFCTEYERLRALRVRVQADHDAAKKLFLESVNSFVRSGRDMDLFFREAGSRQVECGWVVEFFENDPSYYLATDDVLPCNREKPFGYYDKGGAESAYLSVHKTGSQPTSVTWKAYQWNSLDAPPGAVKNGSILEYTYQGRSSWMERYRRR